MLKKRIIPVVVIKGGLAVQSFGFRRYLPVGKPEIAVDFLNQWGADEIAIVDIDASKRGTVDFSLISKLSSQCLVPITYGGGMHTAADMVRAVQAGADKVMVNAGARKNLKLITEAANLLGEQCVIASVDAKKDDSGTHKVFDYLGASLASQTVPDWCKSAQAAGAGEIFLNSVDEDGSKQGYDLALAKSVCQAVAIPVTICGGANHPDHFAKALEIKNVSAVAAANFFHYTEHSVTILKSYLNRINRSDLRLDSHCTYGDSSFLPNGRIARKDDRYLKELLFQRHTKETI